MKWYQHGFTEVPSFQELDDITGATFNEDGTYKGPNEKLDMQVVLDQRTGRKYFAPKEYDDDAINYGLAKFEENFDPKTWWGMVHDPMLSKTEHAVMTGAGIVKGAGNVLLNAPTKIVATATGLTDAVGIDAGHYLEFMAKMHPSFIATSLFRKGIKATAEDYYEAFKRIKTPKGQMGETAALYRASAKNWEDTVNKYLLPDIPENIKANYLLVNLAEMGGQVGGSLLLAAAGNTVGGLSAVAGIFGSQQFYEIREEMLEAGHSLDSANFYAALAGLAEGGIEAFGFSKWLQYATYSKSLRNIFLSSLTEGLQEGLQQTAEETLTRIAGTREADLAGLKQAFMSVAISFAAGAITGGAMSTVTGQLGIRTEKFKHEHGEKYEKGEIIKGPNAQQALELAKANKNSNPLYEAIKNVAADYKLDETTIDKIFISMYNAAKDIKTQEELFAGIARQCVAYKGILNKTPRDIDEENKKAANAINRHLSQEAADKFHADVVNALKARGVDEAKANVQAKVPDMVFKNLSERLGVNLQEFKPVQITAVPANEEYYAGKEDMQEGAPSMDYKGEVPFQDRTNETDKEIAAVQRQIDALDKMHGKPKTNLLSTLRKTGVDYKNTRLDPQKLKELHIKNVPVSKGGLGAEGYEYLVKHGFMPGAEQGDQLTYEDSRELDGAADDMLERAIAGEAVYRMDDAEQVARANEAEGYKAQLEEEKDRLLAEKGKRGYIEIGETVNKIVLGKTADASTLQHELVHHWRNVIETLAARGNKAAQAIKAQMDAIIEKHKDEVKQDINKEEEVLSEAFEKWLYLGGHGNTDGEIKLFRAMQQFFKDIYDGVRSITGVRIDPEIDSFFKQITGLEPIQIQQSNQADSIYQRTDKSKYMTDNEVKAANEDYQAFKAQFASMQAGKMPSADSFTLSRSLPSAYNKIPELKGKRLVMSQSIFKKIINLKNKYGKNHNLDYKRAEKLPLYIADPLYITRSKVQEHEDRFVIITGSRGVGDGVRLSVVVQPSKNVVVVSAYDEVVNISEEKKAKRLVYDKKDELLKTNATSKAAPISNSNSSIANQTGIVKAQKLFQDDIKYDKNGKADINSPEFKQWFGNSKVVDENGKPLVMYHGSPKSEKFDAFDKAKIGQRDEGDFGRLFYFTPDEDYAKAYASTTGVNTFYSDRNIKNGQVYPVYIKLENPRYISLLDAGTIDEEKLKGHDGIILLKSVDLRDDPKELERIKKEITNESYLVRDFEDNIVGYRKIIEVGVKEPTQIKSVYNEGTFDESNPNIYYQTDKDRAFQYSLFKAEEMGEKVADSRPSKEQVAKDVAAIHNGDLSRSQRQESFWDSVGSFFGNTLLSVRQRAGSVSPKLKALFDKLDFWEVNYERKYAEPSKAFIRKFRALEPADRAELDYYIYNRCEEELRAFLKAHNMEKEYNDVRDMLDELFATGNMHGIDMNFMHEYFPTFMANYEGFVSYMLQTDKWTYIDKALKEIDPQNVMSNEEKADYINKLVRGRVPDLAKKPAAAKAREILYKDPNIMKFYAPSDEALQRYVSAMSRAIATHRAFGMGKNGTNSEETVGAIVRELIESKTIDVKEEKLIRHLLKSRLTYQPTPHFVRWMKNVGYLTSMNNITSAITQIGDLYAAFYKYGFSTGWEATFGKREIKMDELGLDDIWEEFKDDKGTALWVRKVFKAVGLSYLDKIGKETAINASLINLRKHAANGNMELSARLAHTFGKDAGRVLADIKAGKITEEIKLLTFCDLADTQPIGQSGVPTGYLNNPTARLFYQLKTFTLGQISLAYADGILNIQNGYKYKNWAQFRKGWQKLFSLAVLLTVANAGADVIKNLVMGRKIDISDTVISNLLWNVGVSKYTFFRGKREGYATSLFYNYMGFPLMSGTDDAVRDIIRTSTGRQELRDTKLVQYIPYGRAYYWWFGGGSESGQARTAKRRKVAAKHNRKKKR